MRRARSGCTRRSTRCTARPDSLDRHVEVLEGLAGSLPALTDAVARLSEQLTELIGLAAPLEAAERELSGLGHLFHRRARRSGAAGDGDPQAVAAAAPTATTVSARG